MIGTKYFIVIGLCFLFTPNTFARPSYAVITGSNCVACHVSPWGGGPRTVYGKFYGSRNLGQGMYSGQDLASASVREVAYYPNATSQSGGGLALMEASGSVNAPVIAGTADVTEVRLVATYNMSPLAPGPREAYVRLAPPATGESSPYYITIGRFNVPFGLLTDEHRTYTKLQTGLTLNNFDNGVAISGNVFSGLSYDLALVNDLQGAGGFTNKDVTYGAVGNMRWQPTGLPFFLGASQNFEYSQMQPEPYATSLYAALSLGGLMSNFINGSVLFEAVSAREWNNQVLNSGLSSFFIPSTDSAYLNQLALSQSMGYYSEIRWDLNKRWTLFYKFDSLQLNTDFPGDVYIRNGFGFEVFIYSNLILNARVEHGYATRPEIETSSSVFASQDDLIAYMRLWL